MRWPRRRRPDLRQRLIEDIRRTAGLMTAVIVDARRLGIEVPIAVTTTVWIWRSWANLIEDQDQ